MKNPKDFFLETFARVKQDTPKYWLQLRIFWAWVTCVSIVIVGLEAKEIELIASVMPKVIQSKVAEICKIAAAVGLFSGLQTKLAVKTPLGAKDPEISTK